jgi:uncharacterized protein YjbI with pentapeptide repeats
MKANEVLRQYAIGERNFSGKNLRGQSFKGKNLSGADFSGADIRGANFNKAFLRNANFSYARAGLQRHQSIFLVAVAFLLATGVGLATGLGGFFALTILASGVIKENFAFGMIGIIALAILFICIVRSGYTNAKEAWGNKTARNVVITVPLSLALAILGVVLFAASLVLNFYNSFDIVIVLTLLGLTFLAIAFLLAVTMAGVGVIAGSLAVAVALSGVIAVAGAIARVFVEDGLLNVTVAVGLVIVGAGVVGLLASYIGFSALNGNKKFSWIRLLAINFAALGGTKFSGADLTEANFTGAILKSTDFRETVLVHTCFRNARNLDQSRQENPSSSMLANPPLRELLINGDGRNKSYKGANLRGAYLIEARLDHADFSGAQLSGATLQGACLEGANLTQAQAIGTNFTSARLTGVYGLETWNIDTTTILEQVDCQFIYLLKTPKPGTDDRERRPSSGEFAPGEFTSLFKEVFNTVDLIFRNGIDWQSFLTSFQKLQVECSGKELFIQAIENKGDGVFVVRVNVPPDANKADVEKRLKREYKFALKAKDKQILQSNKDIISLRKENTSLLRIVQTMAEKDNRKEYTFNAPVGSVENQGHIASSGNQNTIGNAAGEAKAEMKSIQHNYAPEQKQTLTEAAAEIQQLLAQLQTQGYSPEAAQQQVASDLAKRVRSNPEAKSKLAKWGQYLGDAAANGLIGEAVVTVLKLVLQSQGIPIP